MSELVTGTVNPGSFPARRQRLVEMIVELDERHCLAEIENMLSSGWDPMDLLDSCIQGMRIVGQRFEEGRYFIAALIMAGAIMRQAAELIEPHLVRRETYDSSGTIILGTIEGDIHDLGKNLFAVLVRCIGFQVIDLGVDVPPPAFLDAARQTRPDLVGISCVFTHALPELKTAVRAVRADLAPAPPIIIGGTCIDELICRHVDADYWVRDAAQGVRICRKLLQEKLPLPRPTLPE
ncbi:MAG: cobalamin-dependent protein [Pseudomonadota bacterium]